MTATVGTRPGVARSTQRDESVRFVPTDSELREVVLPGPSDEGLRRLHALAAVRRRSQARALLEEVRRDAELPAGETRCAEELAALVDGLPEEATLDVFGSPFAEFDIVPNPSALERLVDPRTPRHRVLSMWRLLVGNRSAPAFDVVLPGSAFPFGGLYLPHLGIEILTQGGPVAVSSGEVCRLTWDDGYRMTLPREGATAVDRSLRSVHLPRARVAPRVAGRPVLSTVASDVRAVFSDFEVADARTALALTEVAEQAHALLRWIWPDAATMVDRTLTGLLLLQPRDGTRSHTSPVLPGVVLTSAAETVAFADLLCHELAHARIGMLVEHDPLLSEDEERYPSPWRSDPRPLMGVLLGVHAFVNVCQFYRHLQDGAGEDPVSAEIYRRQRDNVEEGLALLRRHARPTAVGTRLIEELATEVERL